MFCPECEKSTAGKCMEHSNQVLPTFLPGNPLGHWTWYPTPICIACGKPSDFTVTLPYGSQYDSDQLCVDCIRGFVDFLISEMRRKRNA